MATKTSRSARVKYLAVAALAPLCALAIAGVSAQSAQADQAVAKSSLQGQATVDGRKVVVGTPVTAWVRGEMVAETRTFDIDGMSVYSLEIARDDDNTLAIEGARESELITFRIHDHMAQETGVWLSGKSQFLDLHGDSEAREEPVTIARK